MSSLPPIRTRRAPAKAPKKPRMPALPKPPKFLAWDAAKCCFVANGSRGEIHRISSEGSCTCLGFKMQQVGACSHTRAVLDRLNDLFLDAAEPADHVAEAMDRVDWAELEARFDDLAATREVAASTKAAVAEREKQRVEAIEAAAAADPRARDAEIFL